MMKHISRFPFVSLLIALLAALFTACTLVLDEPSDDSKYAEDLELVGFDEPYTQHTDYGDVTFQYAENTEVLKAKALDYLVKLEHDSVLYFSDDIPQELLIQPGKYVSKGCCHEIPFGLCSRVVSVEHVDGMYKMVTSLADQEDVFEVLEMNLEIDYTPHHHITLPDSAYLVEHGMELDSFVIHDFDYLDGNVDPVTRSSDDEVDYDSEKDHNEDSKEEYTDELVDILDLNTANHDNSVFKAFKPLLKTIKDYGFDFGLKVQEHVKKRIVHEVKINHENKDKTYRKETTVDDSYKLYEISMQYSKDFGSEGSGGSQDPSVVLKNHQDLVENIRNVFKGYNTKLTQNLVIMINIPVPACPAISLFLRVAPMYELEFGLIGKVVVKQTQPTVTSVVETIGKKQVNETPPVKTGYSKLTFKEFNAAGYAKIGGGVELTAGAGCAGGLIGLGVGIYFSVNFVLNLEGNIVGDNNAQMFDRSYVEFFVSADALVRLFLKHWQTKWTIGNLGKWLTSKIGYFPTLDGGENKATSVYNHDDKGAYKTYEVKYKFSELGIAGRLMPKEIEPILRMYYTTPNGDRVYKDIPRTDLWAKEKGLQPAYIGYTFKVTEREMAFEDGKDVTFVPGFTFKGQYYFFDKAVMYPQQTDEPVLSLLGMYLTDVKVYDEDNDLIEGEFDFRDPSMIVYTVVVRVKLTNGSKVPKCWEKWGVRLFVSRDSFLEPEVFETTRSESGVYDITYKLYTYDCEHEYGVASWVEWYWKRDYKNPNPSRDTKIESKDLWIGRYSKVTKLDKVGKVIPVR